MLDRRRTVQGLAVLGAVALATAVVVFANGGPGQTPPEPSAWASWQTVPSPSFRPEPGLNIPNGPQAVLPAGG